MGKSDLGYLGDGFCGGLEIDEAQKTDMDLQELIEMITNAIIDQLKRNTQ